MTAQATINTHSRNRVAARLAWSLWILAMAGATTGLVFLALNRSTPVPASWGFRGFQSVINIAVSTVGALIAWRRARNPIGWLLLASGIIGELKGISEEYAVYSLLTRPGLLPGGAIVAGLGNWLWVPSMGLVTIHTMLFFPDGRLLSPRWRVIVWLGAIWMIMGSVRLIIEPGTMRDMSFAINPFGIENLEARLPWLAFPVFMVLGVGLLPMAAATLSLILRFRQSGGEVRQQLKWLAYAAILGPFAGIIGQFEGAVADLLLFVFVTAIPVAVGIAILRYRLYDIDLLINRTLVFGALTACVALVYVLVVSGLGLLFQSSNSLVVPLLATGLAAVLFQPLRERLQRAVNRMMYGERDNPISVLSRIGKHLEGTASPHIALSGIVKMIAQTLKLPYAAIEFGEGGKSQVIASFGRPMEDSFQFPITYQTENMGYLVVAPRSLGEPLSDIDKTILENIARQAGAVAQAAKLRVDLQRSRQRLVTAREEERRRLRRDLHDGLGPQLASQTLMLDVLEKRIQHDPVSAARLLHDLKEQSQSAILQIRQLVYDLRPPALDELGLEGAIREAATIYRQSKSNIKVTSRSPLTQLPAAVEVAAYRIAQEAITNVSRHAKAQNCEVLLALGDEDGQKYLCVEISDDGIGLPNGQPSGVGLHSMRERAEELGGRITISAGSNMGTLISAMLPFPPAD